MQIDNNINELLQQVEEILKNNPEFVKNFESLLKKYKIKKVKISYPKQLSVVHFESNFDKYKEYLKSQDLKTLKHWTNKRSENDTEKLISILILKEEKSLKKAQDTKNTINTLEY